MTAICQHIRIRLSDNRVIASNPAERRIFARIVFHQGRQDNLLCYAQPDTHGHLLAACTKPAGNQLARRIATSLRYRLALPVSFSPAWVEPVRDGQHLRNSFKYILQQNLRHGLEGDPLSEATSLPDLLGMRLLGDYTAVNVRRLMPRLQRETLVSWLGVKTLTPANEPLDHIVDATLAAAALPALSGTSGQVVAARRALVTVAGHRIPRGRLAEMTNVCPRTITRLRSRTPNFALVQAIRLQLGLISQLAHHATAEGPYTSQVGMAGDRTPTSTPSFTSTAPSS